MNIKLRKKLLIIFVFSTTFLMFSNTEKAQIKKDTLNFISERKDGFVPDEETAVKLAEIYLINIYGDSIMGKFPLKAVLENDYWLVQGSLSGNTVVGGIPYIKISKQTGAVLGYIHTK